MCVFESFVPCRECPGCRTCFVYRVYMKMLTYTDVPALPVHLMTIAQLSALWGWLQDEWQHIIGARYGEIMRAKAGAGVLHP